MVGYSLGLCVYGEFSVLNQHKNFVGKVIHNESIIGVLHAFLICHQVPAIHVNYEFSYMLLLCFDTQLSVFVHLYLRLCYFIQL